MGEKRKKEKKAERPKSIETLRRERKEREAANTPEAKLAAFKKKVAEDAKQFLEDEKKKAEEAARAEEEKKKQAALEELRTAVVELRKLALAGETGMGLRMAKMRVATATKASAALGIDQDIIVE